MDFGEQGRQIALVGGPALGQRQIPGGQGLRQQLGLLDEGVGDEIGEANRVSRVWRIASGRAS